MFSDLEDPRINTNNYSPSAMALHVVEHVGMEAGNHKQQLVEVRQSRALNPTTAQPWMVMTFRKHCHGMQVAKPLALTNAPRHQKEEMEMGMGSGIPHQSYGCCRW